MTDEKENGAPSAIEIIRIRGEIYRSIFNILNKIFIRNYGGNAEKRSL
jgi:hypothetical protein